MVNDFLALFQNETFLNALKAVWSFWPLWLPLFAITIFVQNWLKYIRTKYVLEQGSMLLELKLPKEITKSPAAMEIVLEALSQPSVGSYIDVFIKGRVRPWFSLEIVSLGGQVRFFIWTQKKFKNLIESQIYSQFPTVEVYEVDDYSIQVPYDPSRFSLWGMQLALTKADVYPIKTYIDYGLQDDPKEEYKVDPITPVIEFLGSIKPDDQIWIQILIQPHRKEGYKDARFNEKADWKSGAKKEIEKIMSETPVKVAEGQPLQLTNLTDIQKETISSLQRNLNKTAFDAMVRAIYLAPSSNFNPVNIAGLTSIFKQYGSGNLNGFRPAPIPSIEYPWQDFRNIRKNEAQKSLLEAYKLRSFFQPPYKHFKGKPFVLTTEEIATMFHFPGGVSSTPTFDRIMSKKSEPPSNLPI
jgi:hypothetical protein